MPPNQPKTAGEAAPTVDADFAIGSPRFPDDLAKVHRSDGALAAWRLAYRRLGNDAAAKVGGDYAVALTGDDGSVFLAVDRFAIRSLCYSVDGDRIRVAERADRLGSATKELDPQALFDYLYFHVVPSPRTVFRGVARLPPGHAARFQGGTLKVWRHWTPRFSEPAGADFASLKTEFLAHLEDAVRTRASGNVGCFLSGGTDSSTVAGMLGRVSGRAARTFSIGFDAQGYDEMEFSRIAARHFGTDHNEYYITPDDLVASIPQAAASYDQPFGNSSMVPAYYCALMARDKGVDHMFGGDGGDELFGGNTRYARQRIFGVYDGVPRVLRRGLFEPLLADNPLANRVPLVRKAASYVEQARVPMPDRMLSYNLLSRLGVAEVLTAPFLAAVDTAAPIAHQREVYSSTPAASLVNRMLAFDWRYTLGEIDLPKVVGATRLAGLPVSFPLLDDRLVDFSLGLPASYKVRGLKLRWFFKEALRGFLPDAIITKKKQGFGLPFGLWAASHSKLFALAEDSVMGLAGRGVLRQEFAKALLTVKLREHPGYYGEMIWISMMLEQWLRQHAPELRFA
ncbi:MAG: asparagine synthase [Burkholderiales bacterium]|nr:asparagine synthase [Burkholderiales bacterium]